MFKVFKKAPPLFWDLVMLCFGVSLPDHVWTDRLILGEKKSKGAVHIWIGWVLVPRGRLLPTQAHSCVDCADSPGSCENSTYNSCAAGKERTLCYYLWTNMAKKDANMWHQPCLWCLWPQTEGSMESLAAVLPARETAGGSPAAHKHKCSMLDVLSEIQSLVERSNIINVSMNWF